MLLAVGVLENLLQLDSTDWELALELARKNLWFRGGLAGRDGGIAWIRRDCTPNSGGGQSASRSGSACRRPTRRSHVRYASVAGQRVATLLLVYKDHEWRFRADAKTVITILSAFQANSWGPIDLSAELMEDQIRDGLHYLNSRTQVAVGGTGKVRAACFGNPPRFLRYRDLLAGFRVARQSDAVTPPKEITPRCRVSGTP